jgi:hypothetical protein
MRRHPARAAPAPLELVVDGAVRDAGAPGDVADVGAGRGGLAQRGLEERGVGARGALFGAPARPGEGLELAAHPLTLTTT